MHSINSVNGSPKDFDFFVGGHFLPWFTHPIFSQTPATFEAWLRRTQYPLSKSMVRSPGATLSVTESTAKSAPHQRQVTGKWPQAKAGRRVSEVGSEAATPALIPSVRLSSKKMRESRRKMERRPIGCDHFLCIERSDLLTCKQLAELAHVAVRLASGMPLRPLHGQLQPSRCFPIGHPSPTRKAGCRPPGGP